MRMRQDKSLIVALSKGRMQEQSLALFAEAGIVVEEAELASRKLLVQTAAAHRLGGLPASGS